MRPKLTLLCAALTLTSLTNLKAVEKTDATLLSAPANSQARPPSAEFERMKTLVGEWTGQCDPGQGPVDMTMNYRMLAGGTVLEERVFADTPNEMVTMYYDQNGKLAMTHYCVFGNRPVMKLKSSDGNTIEFDFDAICGINVNQESHMHAMSITFDDADTITTRCVAMVDGQEQPVHPTTLKRSKQ